jgi:O-antigen/teichoic acid export membrane protein
MPADAHAPPQSIGVRYAATLGAQTVRLVYSVAAAVLAPRALGPATYGEYSFLLSTATTLRSFVDTSTQQAFFTFSSQERESGPLTKLYALALGVQFLFVMALIGIAALTGTTHYLWHGIELSKIYWVTLLEWVIFLVIAFQQLGDSKGLTVQGQMLAAGVSVAMLVGLLLLVLMDRLAFGTFVGLNLAGSVVSSVLLGYWLLVRNRALLWSGALRVREYARRWWTFSRPLLLLQYYLPMVAYLGVYLIQRWYGSEEQGYYGLALQWSALALVFTSAAVSVFWREVAHHSAAGEIHLAAATYESLSGTLFFLAVVLAWGLAAASDTLVVLISGREFGPAADVVAVMAFYPVAQTLGQLTVAALKGTERTGTYARCALLLSIPDLLLTYWLVAPRSAAVPGLELGAQGLGIKLAFYGLVSVQLYDWLNRRHLGLRYAPAFRERVLSLALVGLIAWSSLRVGPALLRDWGFTPWPAIALTSLVYGVGVAALVAARPALASVTRAQLTRLIRRANP